MCNSYIVKIHIYIEREREIFFYIYTYILPIVLFNFNFDLFLLFCLLSSLNKFVDCIGEIGVYISAGGGDSSPSPITDAAGAMGDPIVTPTSMQVSVSIMSVLGVSSGGSHAAAHISPFESNLTSSDLTSAR
mgnify:CR=1 FL=1